MEKVNDLLLAGRSGIELSAHLGEPLIELLEFTVDMLAKVDEILLHGVEARRRGLAKIAQLTADLADVAICGTGQHPGGSCVLPIGRNLPSKLAHLVFKGGDARLEIVGLHNYELTSDHRRASARILTANVQHR
ncbi:MAG: hypothetical protein K0U76_03695 [Actinomycetia bacterium]|nr:hypothetical protein [Actinomycetes bacterium]